MFLLLFSFYLEATKANASMTGIPNAMSVGMTAEAEVPFPAVFWYAIIPTAPT